MSTILPWLSRPAWLLALLPLAFFFLRRPQCVTPWQRVVDAHLLAHLLDAGKAGSRSQRLALGLAWLCAVIALSGPRFDTPTTQYAAHRNALHVLVVDLSPAAAPGLGQVKAKLPALLRALAGAEVALLVYAEEPYVVVPPTTDAGLIARFIPELAADATPIPGNRPERALRMAADMLARSKAARRSILWVGGAGPTEMPSDIKDVRLSLFHGTAVPTPAMRAAVERSQGLLVTLPSLDEDVQHLSGALSGGSWTTVLSSSATGADSGYWLLLPLLPLAALRFRRGLLGLLAFCLCTGLSIPSADAADRADREARRLFDAGRYDESAARFSDKRWQALAHYRAGRFAEAARLLEGQEDADSLYNRGNALAKLGSLQEALTLYEASLQLRPGDADTLYNRDLMRRLLNSKKDANRNNTDGAGQAGAQSQRDAARVAEQWLRSVPDESATLLRRKLQIEHQRRASGSAERAW